MAQLPFAHYWQKQLLKLLSQTYEHQSLSQEKEKLQ